MSVRKRTFHVSPAMVVAGIALLVALGGTSIAAVAQLVPRNSVGAAQLRANAVSNAKIRNQAVTDAKIRGNTITSSRIRNGTLERADFRPGQLSDDGPGTPGAPGQPGISGLQRVDVSSSSSSANSKSVVVNCPSGKRIVGGGARVLGTNRVSIVESFPDSSGDRWNARAAEVVGTATNWQLQAYGLCATVAG
jgi:hypothetical protein